MALAHDPAETVRVLISGASGLIGTPLKERLRIRGHDVHVLVRREPHDATEHRFDPATGGIDQGIVDHVDAVINLSGASIAKLPWTTAHKRAILDSRTDATNTIVGAITDSPTPPQSLIQASAVGFYGDRGEEELTENSEPGSGFLAEVTQAWEGATTPLEGSSTRVALARTGLVIAQGGAMTPLRLQTMLGVGGAIGSGRQWWPWISLRDEVDALVFLVENQKLSGAFNLAGPTPVISREVTKTLAHMMKRPHWLGLPEFAVKLLLGEAGRELLLASQKVIPTALVDAGFEFSDKTIADALSSAGL